MGKKRKRTTKKEKQKHHQDVDSSDADANLCDYKDKISEKEKDIEITKIRREELGMTLTIETSMDESLSSSYISKESNREMIISESQPFSKDCLLNHKETSVESESKANASSDDILLFLKLAKHVFRKISQKQSKNIHKHNFQWNPTSIQRQSWPILLQQKNLNFIGVATTGSGKTLSYAIPMIYACMSLIEKKCSESSSSCSSIHGLVIMPTRELAIQVSKVLKIVSKSANKLLSTTARLNNKSNIGALAIYGGVDKQEQIRSLCSQPKQHEQAKKQEQEEQDISTHTILNYLMIAATPMRLIDILGIGDKSNLQEINTSNQKQNDQELMQQKNKIQSLFTNTKYIIIDESDRMAVQSDMSQQVQLILDFVCKQSDCVIKKGLFSATLPEKAVQKCHEWIDVPRVTVKVDTVTVGRIESGSGKKERNIQEEEKSQLSRGDEEINTRRTKDSNAQIDYDHDINNMIESQSSKDAVRIPNSDKKSGDGMESTVSSGVVDHRRGTLDLSTIPSHITQTLHVCSTHKKAKKLITTIQKIRNGEKADGDRQRRNRALIIIFFARIKTLEYTHQLLQKENIQCVPFHSQMNQQKREMHLNNFKSGKTPILLATDIAARGIHCNNVEYIINYDFPSLEQYVHRCGRAGRNSLSCNGEKKLKACVYSFFHRELAPMAKDVLDLLTSCGAWIDPNLISLIPGRSTECSTSASRRKRRNRRGKNNTPIDEDARDHSEILKSTAGMDGDDEEDEFATLGQPRILLKRASHVKDDSDDEEDI